MQANPELIFSEQAKRALAEHVADVKDKELQELLTDTDQLLQHVVNADEQAVKDMIAHDVTLIFNTGSAIDLDGQQIDTSPIQYALYVCDNAMLTLFEAQCRATNLLSVYNDQHPEKYFNFEPFKKIAGDYLTLIERYKKNDLAQDVIMTFIDENIDSERLKLLLPGYILQKIGDGMPLDKITYPPSIKIREIEAALLSENVESVRGGLLSNWRFWRRILYYVIFLTLLIYLLTHLTQVGHWLEKMNTW